eukprot:4814766-Alexandrium_andersonii.AAC.1
MAARSASRSPAATRGRHQRAQAHVSNHWARRRPGSPALVDEDGELDGRGRQPAQLAPHPAADVVGVACPAD